MVAGIPNVGKSTFINSFAGKACAKTGNRPGVTKGKQWIRLNKNVELLDTPGILWPKFEDQEVGIRLAFVGSIKDDILNMEELALTLIGYLKEKYPGVLNARYEVSEEEENLGVLEGIARARGCLKKGKSWIMPRLRGFFLTISEAESLAVLPWNGRLRSKKMKTITEIKMSLPLLL